MIGGLFLGYFSKNMLLQFITFNKEKIRILHKKNFNRSRKIILLNTIYKCVYFNN